MTTLPKTRLLALLALLATLGVGCGEDLAVETKLRADAPDAATSVDVGADAGEIEADAATVEADAADYSPRSVYERGPYRVGFRDFPLTYDAVGEPGRELRVAVWYPTTDTSGAVGRYAGLINRPEVFADAGVGIEEPMPMLVFSHGNGAVAEQSYFLTEFFASHGWVVAAPDHTGNTFRDNQGAINLSSAPYRPQDISAVIDTMLARPADDPLHGRIDAEEIVMAGHSFGGFTTLAVAGASFAVDEVVADCEAGLLDYTLCEAFPEEELDTFRAGFHDPRIKVAIPQTPASADAYREGLADIVIPTMLMTGGQDYQLTNEEEGDPIWAYMQGSPDHVRVDVSRAGHLTFSSMCEYFGGIVPDDGCGPEYIAAELAYEIINAYSLAFARYHLHGDPEVADLIRGEVQPWQTEVTFSTR